MKRRVFWMVLLVSVSLGVGCGGDDDGSGDGNGNGNASGSGGSGGSGTSGSGGSGGGMIPGEGIACGTTRCTPPAGSTAEPCCFDAFSSTCGMRGGFGGGACVELVVPDERCPNVMVGTFTLASCCTDANMCGIMSVFTGGQCVELSVAEQMARDRLMDIPTDGGVNIPFDASVMIPTIDFPDPRACQ